MSSLSFLCGELYPRKINFPWLYLWQAQKTEDQSFELSLITRLPCLPAHCKAPSGAAIGNKVTSPHITQMIGLRTFKIPTQIFSKYSSKNVTSPYTSPTSSTALASSKGILQRLKFQLFCGNLNLKEMLTPISEVFFRAILRILKAILH